MANFSYKLQLIKDALFIIACLMGFIALLVIAPYLQEPLYKKVIVFFN